MSCDSTLLLLSLNKLRSHHELRRNLISGCVYLYTEQEKQRSSVKKGKLIIVSCIAVGESARTCFMAPDTQMVCHDHG